MDPSNFKGICSGIVLDTSSMMLIFSMESNEGNSIKYACTCQSFAEGMGIDHSKLSVDDWNKFCENMRGKSINFIVKDG
jgi:hypothetical protein